MEIYEIKKGQRFYRVEASEKRKYDNPKFYSYFRDAKICDKKVWSRRCGKYCRFLEVETKRDLNLLLIPYKSVLYTEEVSESDKILAKKLIRLAKMVYKNDKDKIEEVKDAVKDLIHLEGRSLFTTISSDWTLANLICRGGFDGLVRFIDNKKTNCLDEVAICFPDNKLKIITDQQIQV